MYQKEVDFYSSIFKGEADFSRSSFKGEANFSKNEFGTIALFSHVLFEQQNKIVFNDNDLSNVSFSGCDITRVRFGDKITWGDKKVDFSIIEEEWLRQKSKGEIPNRDASLDLVLSVCRNLRENYEFRLRYDEAGKLFIKEMELKRMYRTVPKKSVRDLKSRKTNSLESIFP
jgi:hypothetical protein